MFINAKTSTIFIKFYYSQFHIYYTQSQPFPGYVAIAWHQAWHWSHNGVSYKIPPPPPPLKMCLSLYIDMMKHKIACMFETRFVIDILLETSQNTLIGYYWRFSIAKSIIFVPQIFVCTKTRKKAVHCKYSVYCLCSFAAYVFIHCPFINSHKEHSYICRSCRTRSSKLQCVIKHRCNTLLGYGQFCRIQALHKRSCYKLDTDFHIFATLESKFALVSYVYLC